MSPVKRLHICDACGEQVEVGAIDMDENCGAIVIKKGFIVSQDALHRDAEYCYRRLSLEGLVACRPEHLEPAVRAKVKNAGDYLDLE